MVAALQVIEPAFLTDEEKGRRLTEQARALDYAGMERSHLYSDLLAWGIDEGIIDVPQVRGSSFTMGLLADGLAHRIQQSSYQERPVSRRVVVSSIDAKASLDESLRSSLGEVRPSRVPLTIDPSCAPRTPLLITDAFSSLNYVVGGVKTYVPDMTIRKATKVIEEYRQKIGGLFEGIAPLLHLVKLAQERCADLDAPWSEVISEHEANVAASKAKMYRQSRSEANFDAMMAEFHRYDIPDFAGSAGEMR